MKIKVLEKPKDRDGAPHRLYLTDPKNLWSTAPGVPHLHAILRAMGWRCPARDFNSAIPLDMLVAASHNDSEQKTNNVLRPMLWCIVLPVEVVGSRLTVLTSGRILAGFLGSVGQRNLSRPAVDQR